MSCFPCAGGNQTAETPLSKSRVTVFTETGEPVFSARHFGPEGRESYSCPSQLPKPYVNQALGGKQLLAWILTDSSSSSGSLDFHFADRGGPYLFPFRRPDVTASLAYGTLQCLRAIAIFFPKVGRQYLWGLRVGSDKRRGQRWPFLCHQY